jgi:hypothetical protein
VRSDRAGDFSLPVLILESDVPSVVRQAYGTTIFTPDDPLERALLEEVSDDRGLFDEAIHQRIVEELDAWMARHLFAR